MRKKLQFSETMDLSSTISLSFYGHPINIPLKGAVHCFTVLSVWFPLHHPITVHGYYGLLLAGHRPYYAFISSALGGLFETSGLGFVFGFTGPSYFEAAFKTMQKLLLEPAKPKTKPNPLVSKISMPSVG